MRRILVVEGLQLNGSALAPVLGEVGDIVRVDAEMAADFGTAWSWQPDIIILNDDCPGADALELLKQIRRDRQDIPVMVVSSRTSEAYRVHAFALGADDYVTRPVSALELSARLQSRLRSRPPAPAGDGNVDGTTFRFGNVVVYPSRRAVFRLGREVALSPKAFDLLMALLARDGAVVHRSELLQEVWGYKAPVVTRTVDIHIAELRQKLEESTAAPRHIKTVRKVGYRLDR